MADVEQQQNICSNLILLNLKNNKEKIILREKRHFEAPNWSRDNDYLIINSNGLLEKISLNGNFLETIDTHFAINCNNDHLLSFDGKTLAISHNDTSVAEKDNSRIFILPAEGGIPQLITKNFPSYLHGISPDGTTFIYTAKRNEKWNIYSINSSDKIEYQLTDGALLDDGPEFSYDGNWIYFNSHRTNRMHLYRMKPDGSKQEQLTDDDYDNWFPHPSPDNKTIVYISYLKDQKGLHPFGQDVMLRQMDLETKEIKDLTPVFYGGQGSINVPSWSPDGEWIAYVKYEKI